MIRYELHDNTLLPPAPPVLAHPPADDYTIATADLWILFVLLVGCDVLVWLTW